MEGCVCVQDSDLPSDQKKMYREWLSAGGNVLGTPRRFRWHAWLLSAPGYAPWVDPIMFDGLSETIIFQVPES